MLSEQLSSQKDEDSAIRVENISKMYRIYQQPSDRLKDFLLGRWKRFHSPFWALQGISFEVSRGHTVGIIGRNGAGKTTMLEIIAGTLTPTTGRVEVRGRTCALLALGAGFNPEFTGRENVLMYGAIMGFGHREIAERLPSIEAFAQIGEFIDQPMKTYSSGMLVRLAFSVVVHVEPTILIVDEAISVGDMLFQKRCMERMETLRRRGCTILFVSHDIITVQSICDHAILLESGRMVCQGDPKEIVQEYKKIMMREEEKYLASVRPLHYPGIVGPESGVNGQAAAETPPNAQETGTVEPAPGDYETEEAASPAGDDSTRRAESPVNPSEREIGSLMGRDARIARWEMLNEEGEPASVFQVNEETVIRMWVKFFKDVELPNFAFFIQNKNNVLVYETGTYYQRIQVEPVLAGETRMVEFRQRLRLTPGHFFINFGVGEYIYESGQRLLDRKFDAIHFQLMSDATHIGGVVNLESKITIWNCDKKTAL
ncbi:MAG: ABC transporter ATP-binding protein [Deltaproteobacteria bacterium]|nr:ABC transporter ATP-binding protein [Deltaproteobacteria bacterium]